jgi:hypothetical protein
VEGTGPGGLLGGAVRVAEDGVGARENVVGAALQDPVAGASGDATGLVGQGHGTVRVAQPQPGAGQPE